ncbi:MAG: cupin domain-containing protein [Deferrisomatales bacterium]|nr:cupin domain-containing protein [Deferrisomatales bacterium]
MFSRHTDDGYREAVPGISFRTLNHGRNTLMAEFRLAAASRLPPHSHPHEQAGYLVSGRMQLVIGDAVFEATPGDSWCVPGGVEHRVVVLEDAVAVEVFSPVREEYLD